MKRKTGFSMKQHNIVGRKLRQVNTDLIHLRVAVSHHYTLTGPRSSRVLNSLGKITAALSTARSELEELMAKEHPKDWGVEVYYGAIDADPEMEALKNSDPHAVHDVANVAT